MHPDKPKISLRTTSFLIYLHKSLITAPRKIFFDFFSKKAKKGVTLLICFLDISGVETIIFNNGEQHELWKRLQRC